jgi:hypothetical protein
VMVNGTSCIVLRMSNRLCFAFAAVGAMLAPGDRVIGDSARAATVATNRLPAAM